MPVTVLEENGFLEISNDLLLRIILIGHGEFRNKVEKRGFDELREFFIGSTYRDDVVVFSRKIGEVVVGDRRRKQGPESAIHAGQFLRMGKAEAQ